MNRLDREIMKAILADNRQSIYRIEEYLRKNLKKELKETGIKVNYASVWRHIKKMQKDDLLYVKENLRKNGKPDKRETEMPELTPKGLATLMIDGDLQEEELRKANEKIFQKDFEKILPKKDFFMLKPVFADVFSKSLLEIRPKINLKFFDEKWFYQIYYKTVSSNIKHAIKKYRPEFEKEGVWLSEEEAEKEVVDFLGNLPQELFNKLPRKTKENFGKLRKKYPELKVSREE